MHTGVLLYAVCASTNKYLGVIIRDISLNIKWYLASYEIEIKNNTWVHVHKKWVWTKITLMLMFQLLYKELQKSLNFAPDSS